MARNLAPDWILQQTLEVQRQAAMAWKGGNTDSSPSDDSGLTLTVLGCGTMGIAILGGIMDSLQSKTPDSSDDDTPTPSRLPRKFLACVRRPQSAKRVHDELDKYGADLTVHENDNLGPIRAADVILLGCKPHMIDALFGADGVRAALRGKVLISICAGVPEAQLRDLLGAAATTPPDACVVVRAMPNTAAAVRESMTVIGRDPTAPAALDSDTDRLVTWIFTRIGRVIHLPSTQMDVVTALCGSGPAFVAVVVESLAAGAIAMGLPRDEAYTMAAQTVRGTTGLLLRGEHPAILRDKVTTPGGCTIGGLLVLEEGNVRGTVARAVREATVVASQLGQGKQGVNGTRF